MVQAFDSHLHLEAADQPYKYSFIREAFTTQKHELRRNGEKGDVPIALVGTRCTYTGIQKPRSSMHTLSANAHLCGVMWRDATLPRAVAEKQVVSYRIHTSCEHDC